MSEYDKLQYLATILSLNPVDFYNFLKTSVGQNSDKAPIASQEYASKVAIAQTTQTYRDIMKYAFDKSGSNLYNANNTVIITGDAGSGKTSVVGKSVIDFWDLRLKYYVQDQLLHRLRDQLLHLEEESQWILNP